MRVVRNHRRRVVSATGLLALMLGTPSAFALSAVTAWNDSALAEVRLSKLGPPIVARALAVANTCMYDAWTAYDASALPTAAKLQRRPSSERTEANKSKAISFAAYRCLVNLFPAGATRLAAAMVARGYDPNDTGTSLSTPQGIGNVAAGAVIAVRRNDGSNQYGDLRPGAYADPTYYVPRNVPMPFCLPTTVADCTPNAVDMLHWQPLINNVGVTQTYVAPHWENVTPFALSSAAQYDNHPLLAAGPNYLRGPANLAADMQQILLISSQLTPAQKLSVEYWADGPESELPPGHWILLAQFVSARDALTIDRDVKMFFALSNANHDAGIVAWHQKRRYEGVRPITPIRTLYKGAPILAWGGPGRSTEMFDGSKWTPYNPGSNLTPAFPGWLSGHGTFSGASAAVLRSFTGSDALGFTTVIPPNFGRVEPGVPSVATALTFPTFSVAASEAAMSRLYAGIHFNDDNQLGLQIGELVGLQAWDKARFLFQGGMSRIASSSASAAGASALSWTHSVDGTRIGRMLLVGVSGKDGNTAQSVTYKGLPLRRLSIQGSDWESNTAELWYLPNPPGGSGTVSVQMGWYTGVVAGAMTVQGVNLNAPFGTPRGNGGWGSAGCVTLANEPAQLAVSVFSTNGDASYAQAPSGFVTSWNAISDPPSFWNFLWTYVNVIGVGSIGPAAPMRDVCNYSSWSSYWSMVAVPLNPAYR